MTQTKRFDAVINSDQALALLKRIAEGTDWPDITIMPSDVGSSHVRYTLNFLARLLCLK